MPRDMKGTSAVVDMKGDGLTREEKTECKIEESIWVI